MLGLEPGKTFSDKVLYVYSKQLEEADILVVNKCDLLGAEQADRFEEALRQRYPKAELFRVSARRRDRAGSLVRRSRRRPSVPCGAFGLDYDAYAEGEALLGWLNAPSACRGEPFDGNRLLLEVTGQSRRLSAESIEIAHLKMTLTPDEETGGLGTLNLVSGSRGARVAVQAEAANCPAGSLS